MSADHAALRRDADRFVLSDLGSRNGSRVDGEKVAERVLRDGALIEVGRSFLLFRASGGAGPSAQAEPAQTGAPGFATFSAGFAAALQRLRALAPTSIALVLHGESGTGKEVLARAVHALSHRKGALVPVNCGALASTLLESELFGHRKGAFSGASEERAGLVRSAEGGTLFLDEIADLPLPAQTALLRVLQEGEVLPVGASRPLKVDFRVVAATHRDLEAMAAQGTFRPDLLARLSGYTLLLPPLRERREDLGLLIGALLGSLPEAERGALRFSPEAARALLGWRYPLNVRELEKALGAAVVFARGGEILPEHLPPAIAAAGSESGPKSLANSLPAPAARAPSGEAAPGAKHPPQARATLSPRDAALRERLVAALQEHRGNLTAVARALGKARVQIQRWVRRFELDAESFRDEL